MEKRKVLPLQVIEPRPSRPKPVTTPTELCRLLSKILSYSEHINWVGHDKEEKGRGGEKKNNRERKRREKNRRSQEDEEKMKTEKKSKEGKNMEKTRRSK
jgi:hypothetical protein